MESDLKAHKDFVNIFITNRANTMLQKKHSVMTQASTKPSYHNREKSRSSMI